MTRITAPRDHISWVVFLFAHEVRIGEGTTSKTMLMTYSTYLDDGSFLEKYMLHSNSNSTYADDFDFFHLEKSIIIYFCGARPTLTSSYFLALNLSV